jgi:mono/diheme cytochrome c family protein
VKRAALLACVLALGGCERAMHDMYRQPRYDPGEASPLFPDGRAERPPPQGSVPVAAGKLAMTSSGRAGRELPAEWQVAQTRTSLPPITPALLARGQQRYEIYCLPCHSPVGDGDGPIVRRGFPHPPSYHEQRLREAPDRHFYDVISQGYGIMHSYADRVAPQDRWAIVAYIRALQLSQHAQVAQLPAQVRAKLPGDNGTTGGGR